MSGKDAIIEKIKTDAQAVMNGISEDARTKGMEIQRVASEDAKIYSEKQRAASFEQREEIIRRRMTVADLEVKKMLLGAKQELMRRAFDEAAKAIRSDRPAYEKMLIGMLRCADDGDKVTFSENDKDLVTEKWFEEVVSKLDKKPIMDPEYGNFSGGILISGVGSDKNFTLEVELSCVREEYEPQIAKLLFGE